MDALAGGGLITPVVLAGGTGSRLWPMSTVECPKQFCDIDDGRSLFQQTLLRCADDRAFGAPVIVATRQHRQLLESQLKAIACEPRLVIVEPDGRNTAASVLVAAAVLRQEGDGRLLILPSDHRIDDVEAFVTSVAMAASDPATADHITTIGIEPDHAHTGFGYVCSGDPIGSAGLRKVSRFVEKPDEATARQLLDRGDVFWNSGLLLGQASVFMEEACSHAPLLEQQIDRAVRRGVRFGQRFYPDEDVWNTLPTEPFDCAIMERTRRALVLPVSFDWSDIGSWSAIWNSSSRDDQGNAIVGPCFADGTSDSLLRSDGPAIAISGLSNISVVAENGSVLVAAHDSTQQIGVLRDAVEAASFAAEDAGAVAKPWGTFDVLSSDPGYQVKRLTVEPGEKLSMQYHRHRSETWVVVRGTASVTVGDKRRRLPVGSALTIEKGVRHRLENNGRAPLVLIEVQTGAYLGEDDIVRLDDDYGRCDPDNAALLIGTE